MKFPSCLALGRQLTCAFGPLVIQMTYSIFHAESFHFFLFWFGYRVVCLFVVNGGKKRHHDDSYQKVWNLGGDSYSERVNQQCAKHFAIEKWTI